MRLQDKLRPGDCLLYRPASIFGWLITIKTWHRLSHIEVYVGDGYSVASRDGIGVGAYPLRTDHLAVVLRPKKSLDIQSALLWFMLHAKGHKYDWLGLLRFAWGSPFIPEMWHKGRQFCSEFATLFYRAGGFDPFPRDDADAIAPFEFYSNPEFDLVR